MNPHDRNEAPPGAALLLLVMMLAVPAGAQVHLVAGYADADRALSCVEAPPGSTVTHHGFAFVPPGDGMAYVTFRLSVPDNLVPSGAPRPRAVVSDLIITPFADGTWEWNLLVTGCPPGWTEVFRQDYVVQDAAPAALAILAAGSMLRDCAFALNDVAVAAGLAVNDPDCGGVGTVPVAWGRLKARYH